MKTNTVTIGTEPYAVGCPAPHPLGFWSAVSLTVRGWLDASRNRGVADTEHTHTLWWLQNTHRRNEQEVVRRVDGVLSRLDAAIAVLDARLAAAGPEQTAAPDRSDLAGATDATRAAWARQARDARSSRTSKHAADADRETARIARAELVARRESVRVEADDVRSLWAEAYGIRAARYTRARFTRWGGPVAEDPQFPPYGSVKGTRPMPLSHEVSETAPAGAALPATAVAAAVTA